MTPMKEMIEWLTGQRDIAESHNHLPEAQRLHGHIGLAERLLKKEKEMLDAAREDEAIRILEWLKTFEPLEKINGQWVLESQISSEKLYSGFLRQLTETRGKDIKSLSDEDAIKCAELFGGFGHLSDKSKISQIKDLLCTNKLHTSQTNIAGYGWYCVFSYLEKIGYKI